MHNIVGGEPEQADWEQHRVTEQLLICTNLSLDLTSAAYVYNGSLVHFWLENYNEQDYWQQTQSS